METVYETDRVWAFHHPKPEFDPVQILLIPKEHVTSLVTLPDHDRELHTRLIRALSVVGSKIVEEHGACQIHVNMGQYLHAHHLHFQLTKDDRIRHSLP